MRAHLITTLLALAPLFAAFAPLLWGRYPGERVLVRAAPHTPNPGRRQADLRPPQRRARLAAPRGGRLIAWRVGGRAPPAPQIAVSPT